MAISHIRERLNTVIAERYQLLRIIGDGGMGAVFEACHLPSGQRVAVKLIKPEYTSSPEVNARFVQECQVVGALGHPNIVRLLDAGEDEDGPFLVLELLEGETLADVLDRRALGVHEALEIAESTLDALRAAHAVGVVHRDIKPDNIFLIGGADHRQGVKLLDFGISKIVTEQAMGGGITRVGTAVGTPDYMSPEQAGGGRVDGRADLWSLGAVLYEAVAQAPPFDGESYQQLISRIIVNPHTPLLARVPTAPPEFSAFIDRCLQKEPDQRFASAEEMLDETRRLRGSLPWDEYPAGRDEPTSIFAAAGPSDHPYPAASTGGAYEAAPTQVRVSIPPLYDRTDVQHEFASMEAAEATVINPDAFAPRPLEHPPHAAPMLVPSRPPAPGRDPSQRAVRRNLAIAVAGLLLIVGAGAVALVGDDPSPPPAPLASPAATAVVEAHAQPVNTPPPPLPTPAPQPAEMPVAQALSPTPPTPTPAPVPAAPRAPSTHPPRAAEAPPRRVSVRPSVPAADPSRAGQPLDQSEFLRSLVPVMPALRRCYRGRPGNVSGFLDVDASGRVRRLRFDSPAEGDPRRACVLDTLRTARFPPQRPTTGQRIFSTFQGT